MSDPDIEMMQEIVAILRDVAKNSPPPSATPVTVVTRATPIASLMIPRPSQPDKPHTSDKPHPVDRIFDLYRTLGHRTYSAEPVTQLEHALQAAKAATFLDLPKHVIVACLLHDVGHLLVDQPQMPDDLGTVDHETIGALYLRRLGMQEMVCRLIEQHVQAKRYLVTTRPEYRQALSEASKRTLELQHGLMSPEQVLAFEALPYKDECLQVRMCDEQGKEIYSLCSTGQVLSLPTLEDYRDFCLQLITVPEETTAASVDSTASREVEHKQEEHSEQSLEQALTTTWSGSSIDCTRRYFC